MATLYDNLLASLYAVDEGLDSEFIGALLAPIKVDRADWRHSAEYMVELPLAVIPALRIRRLRINLRTAKGQLTRFQRRFLRMAEAGRVNDLGGYDPSAPISSREAFHRVQGMREEIAEAEAALTKALA